MTYLVITPDGTLHTHAGPPSSPVIHRHVGEGGWDMVRTHGNTRGFVNDVGYRLDLPRNLVGTCLLASIGAVPRPYAGPIVITGWDPHHFVEISPLTAEQVTGLTQMHTDIRIVLGLDTGTPSGNASDPWQNAMHQVAEIVRTAPTPEPTVIRSDDPAWPFR